jgi:hypothetical protein
MQQSPFMFDKMGGHQSLAQPIVQQDVLMLDNTEDQLSDNQPTPYKPSYEDSLLLFVIDKEGDQKMLRYLDAVEEKTESPVFNPSVQLGFPAPAIRDSFTLGKRRRTGEREEQADEMSRDGEDSVDQYSGVRWAANHDKKVIAVVAPLKSRAKGVPVDGMHEEQRRQKMYKEHLISRVKAPKPVARLPVPLPAVQYPFVHEPTVQKTTPVIQHPGLQIPVFQMNPFVPNNRNYQGGMLIF